MALCYDCEKFCGKSKIINIEEYGMILDIPVELIVREWRSVNKNVNKGLC